MRKKQYNYNHELIRPQGKINCNRNNPVIAWKERKSVLRNQKEVEAYVPPKGIRLRKSCYDSYDKEQILFYIIESKAEQKEPVPCIVYFHGGGFMMPLQTMMLENASFYAAKTGYKVFLPEYRYAPKAPCRTTIEDCFYMVRHLMKHYMEYGVDPARMILYGDSAGGALAAGTAHLMRDRGLPAAAGQMLVYPVADHHSERYASMEKYKDAVWPKKSNLFMWKYYLKGAGEKAVRYASPMNMADFKGLPSAYVEPQEIDILLDEGIAYAKKLEQAGCLLELNVIPGSYHGFDWDHTSALVQRVLVHRCEVMRKLCGEDIQAVQKGEQNGTV